MVFLDDNTIYVRRNNKGIVYNATSHKLMRTNSDVIKILMLCNGTSTLEEIVESFHLNVRESVRNILCQLLEEGMITKEPNLARTEQQENITSFFISLTKSCNLNCSFCLKGNMDYTNEMNLEQWKAIVDIIQRYNEKKKNIYITGGEPFLLSWFKEFYCYLYQKGMTINLFTNGTLISEDYIEFLKKYPPRTLLLSVDGSKAKIHDHQRGINGAFDKVIEATKRILDTIETVVIWQTVVNRENLEDIENIAVLAEKIGVKNLHFGCVSAIGLGIGHEKNLSTEELFWFYEKVAQITEQHLQIRINLPIESILGDSFQRLRFSSCGIGNMLYINEQGYLYPCYGMENPKYRNGPVRVLDDLKHPFGDSFFNKSLNDYEVCRSCGVRYFCRGGCKAEIYNLHGTIQGCNEEKKLALEKYVWEHFKTEDENTDG